MILPRTLLTLTIAIATLAVGSADDQKKAIPITIASYANSDASKSENRVLVLNQTAYRSVQDFIASLSRYGANSGIHFAIYGTCDANDPRLTLEEIQQIQRACEKTGLGFTYIPGG